MRPNSSPVALRMAFASFTSSGGAHASSKPMERTPAVDLIFRTEESGVLGRQCYKTPDIAYHGVCRLRGSFSATLPIVWLSTPGYLTSVPTNNHTIAKSAWRSARINHHLRRRYPCRESVRQDDAHMSVHIRKTAWRLHTVGYISRSMEYRH